MVVVQARHVKVIEKVAGERRKRCIMAVGVHICLHTLAAAHQGSVRRGSAILLRTFVIGDRLELSGCRHAVPNSICDVPDIAAICELTGCLVCAALK